MLGNPSIEMSQNWLNQPELGCELTSGDENWRPEMKTRINSMLMMLGDEWPDAGVISPDECVAHG